MTARLARYELPGKRWYIAVCEECRWVAMGWKARLEAVADRDGHNARNHAEPRRTMFGELPPEMKGADDADG